MERTKLSILCWALYAEHFMLNILCWVFYAERAYLSVLTSSYFAEHTLSCVRTLLYSFWQKKALHVLMVSHLVWSPIERPDMHDCTHKWVNVEDFLDADLYFVFCIKASWICQLASRPSESLQLWGWFIISQCECWKKIELQDSSPTKRENTVAWVTIM